MMAIPCQCSSGRMKPSNGKASPYIEAYCSTAIASVSHFIACCAIVGGHHAFACLIRVLEIEEWFSRLTPKVVPVVTSLEV